MINVNHFHAKTDSETIEKAMAHKSSDGIILIPPRSSDIEPERNFWLIDRAILLEENTTIIMQNSTLKLSDRCRDNFFRTANCGLGIEFPKRIKNVHIKGEGTCTLIGADHPRASGDSGKRLANPCPHAKNDICQLDSWTPPKPKNDESIERLYRYTHSYGTDAGTNESPYGDWRGIGILFANTENFSIENLHIQDPHCWSISLEECAHGSIEKICLNSCQSKMIDDIITNLQNQDGIDLRNGCHDIIISDITGKTGDDLIALTAIADQERYYPGGSLRTTHVMHNDWTKRDRNIHDITIKNVTASSEWCLIIRILPVMASIYNIIIDGIIDTTPEDKGHSKTILLGGDANYGTILPNSMKNILISNVICNAKEGIVIGSDLSNSVISNVINQREGIVLKTTNEHALKNVILKNIVSSQE